MCYIVFISHSLQWRSIVVALFEHAINSYITISTATITLMTLLFSSLGPCSLAKSLLIICNSFPNANSFSIERILPPHKCRTDGPGSEGSKQKDRHGNLKFRMQQSKKMFMYDSKTKVHSA